MYKILVIDDSMLMRAYFKVGLQKVGYEVVQAEDATIALHMLREGEVMPDFIFTDILMPKMNGYAFCRVLKEDEKYNHIPIILVTSLGSEWDQQHAKKCGADGFIKKPFPIELAVEKIVSFLP